jgi:hypothetical protein
MIKIEVTGNSIPEVADKLLAIGASLRSTASNAADDAAREALQAKRDAANEDKAARVMVTNKKEVAEAAPVDPTPAPKSAPAATVSESLRTTTETSSIPAPASNTGATAADVLSSQPTTKEPSTTPAPASLDFDTDVAPHVLAVVQKLGKPAAQEILSQFGVEKASLLDPARWPELVTALQDAI